MWTQKAETIKKYLIYLATRDFTRGVLLPGAPDRAFLNKLSSESKFIICNYNLARYGGTIPNEKIAFRHSSILVHPHKLYMVEVVGTAPTSAMFITKFVYRHSWKSNTNNIKLYFKDSIYLL